MQGFESDDIATLVVHLMCNGDKADEEYILLLEGETEQYKKIEITLRDTGYIESSSLQCIICEEDNKEENEKNGELDVIKLEITGLNSQNTKCGVRRLGTYFRGDHDSFRSAIAEIAHALDVAYDGLCYKPLVFRNSR